MTTNPLAQAGRELEAILGEVSNVPLLFVASGGSALGILDHCGISGRREHTLMSVLDERFDERASVNNFLQFADTRFYKEAREGGAAVIDTSVSEGDTMNSMASMFEQELRFFTQTYPEGKIVATLGLGEDAHISGIMPYPEDPQFFVRQFDDESAWVRGYDATGKNEYPMRITTTLPFLRRIDHALLYVVGEVKRDAWERLVLPSGELYEVPSRVVHEMRDVRVYTDLI